MISQETIKQVKDLPIADVVQYYGIKVKNAGANKMALCPFIEEKTPSFILYSKNNNYYCEGCKAAGDTIAFVMRYSNLDFMEAVEDLAKNHHITIQYDKNVDAAAVAKKKEEAKQTIDLVAELHAQYVAAMSADALDYLQKRGFNPEQVKTLGYGFAPKACRFAQQVFQKYPQIGRALGYIKEGEDGSQFDFFRNRIIVPIYNMRGQVIAFAGRLWDTKPGDKEFAKWINSAGSELYDKSAALYGISRASAAIRKSKECYLVEGYFDVDAAYLHGIENIVAPCGTSLTDKQVQMIIKAGAELITFIPDRDSITEDQELNGKTISETAGFQAVLRGIDEASRAGAYTKVIDLPQADIRQKVDLHSFLMEDKIA